MLQLVEEGRLSLDARLPDTLPASVVGRFPDAADITVRMLLGHRSGIPEWDQPALDEQIARHPSKVWKVSEFLDRAAAQPPVFAPGTGFFYRGVAENGKTPQTDYMVVTHQTKQIMGVTATVVRDTVSSHGHPIETHRDAPDAPVPRR